MVSRIAFVVVSVAAAVAFSLTLFPVPVALVAGVGAGVAAFLIGWLVEYALTALRPKAALGLAVGLSVAAVAFFAVSTLAFRLAEAYGLEPAHSVLRLLLPLVFLVLFYLGVKVGVMKGREVELGSGGKRPAYSTGYIKPKILDTSVIIDGRIADVAETGFIEGVMIIPKFVIKELQYIADSGDPVKRVRGRRGLDVLKRMQQEIPGVAVKITSHDFSRVREVDLKLVELAKKIGGTVITNDFNLNKIAALHGVKVLNLNELANALKPIVLPGETMHIRVVKEGKEANQGVGYLEDGTMVVVDDARNYVGKEINVSVTSVLQTPTGRMIFSKVKAA